MVICEKCKNEMAPGDPDPYSPFPAYAVVGGILGVVGAALTGQVLLVAAGLFAGAGLGAIMRCGRCGAEISEDEPRYELMRAFDDEQGRPFYRPVAKPPDATPLSPKRQGQTRQDPYVPDRRPDESGQGVFDHLGPSSSQPAEKNFVFDDVQAKLVPRERRDHRIFDFDVDVGPDPDAAEIESIGRYGPSSASGDIAEDGGWLDDIEFTFDEGYSMDDEDVTEDPLL